MKRAPALLLAILLPVQSYGASVIAPRAVLPRTSMPLAPALTPLSLGRVATLPMPLPLSAARLAPAVLASPSAAAPQAQSALSAMSALPAPRADAPAEAVSADAARRFDLAPARAEPGDAVAADAPPPGEAPSSGGLAPSGESGPSLSRARIPDLPNHRPFLLRHYGAVKTLLAPILKLVYPVAVSGSAHIPATGPVLIVANHAGYLDPLLVAYAAGRPVRFMMARDIYEGWKPLTWFFRGIGAIPVEAGSSRESVAHSLGMAKAALNAGEVVVIFPEGKLTRTGAMDKFKRGFENLARETEATVVPAHVDGVWGSVFSRREDFRPLWRRVLAEAGRRTAVRFGPPLASPDTLAARQAVQELGADNMEARIRAKGKTLARELFVSAKRRWSRPALVDGAGRSLSYGQVLAESVALGRALEPALGPGPRVGVLARGSVDGALANIGLTLRGRAPVNLDPSGSPEALAHAASRAGLDTVVVSRRLADRVDRLPPGLRVVYLEDALAPSWMTAALAALLRALPRAWGEALFARKAARSLDETAAVFYTRGATGAPRPVELSHLNLRANSEMIREAYSFRPDDVILAALPYFHSFGFALTLWTPLLKGLTVAYHPDPRDAAGVGAFARRTGATVLLGTPGAFERYAAEAGPDDFRTLRFAVTGSETLRPEQAEAFRARFGVKPLEGYGASELSPVAALNVPDRSAQKGTVEGTVGQPLPGQAMRVVDPDTFAPLPPGSVGLLLVKGANVMKGYLGDPRGSAAAVRDGWYVTHDLAVIDREGFVRLVGRSLSGRR